MKKALVLSASMLLTSTLQAQEPWMQGLDQSGRIKLEDVIRNWEKQQQERSQPAEPEEAGMTQGRQTGKVIKEGKSYHFDRWLWYMQQQTDEQGYIVSPLYKWQELQRYQNKLNAGRALAKTTSDQSDWQFVGPDYSPGGYNGIGRTNIVAFHPTDTNTYWVGSAGGGAWKTTDNGVNWTIKTEHLPVLGISDIVFNHQNGNTMYLCTGDRDASDSYSVGVLKSFDGGDTWNQTGLLWTVQQNELTNSLVMNAADTNSLVLATSAGIYKTQDGGANWTLVLGGNYKQVLYHPTDTAIVYATGRAVTGGFQIYRSVNGGYNWTKITAIGGTTRIALAVTPAAPNLVKAVVSNSSNGLEGIYTSSNAGASFTKIFGGSCSTNILSGNLTLNNNTCSGQGWYDLCIAISPLDSNKVFVGGVNTWHSNNGGLSWQITNQWYAGLPGIKTVHADKHWLAFHPLRPNTLFECNDGGIYRSANPTSLLWNDLSNGLGITQFYRNAVHGNTTFVLGGSQDNGSKRINFNGSSAELTGGDGMNCEFDWNTPSTFYTAIQYGDIRRTTNSGANFVNISNNIPGQPTGEWITPYTVHPRIPDLLIAGYDRLYYSDNRGNTWSVMSPVFSSQRIRRISVANNNPMDIGTANYVYLLYGTSNLRVSADFGSNWSSITVPYGGTISDILVDPQDSTHLWITFSGYGTNKVADYHPGRPGGDWKLHNSVLPNVPVLCIAIDSGNGTRYIGTDVGVFYMDTTMAAWAPYSTGMPNVPVTDLGINYTTNELWASTYGRGMWRSPRREFPLPPPNGIGIVPLSAQVLTVSPNPARGQFTITTTHAGLQNQQASLRLYDAAGRVAWSGSQSFRGGAMDVHTSGLARGVYILEVHAPSGMTARSRVVMLD